MIEAKDLRIGNWVKGTIDDETPWLVSGKTIARLENNDFDLFGIELTPEILVKCGFEWVGKFLSIDLKHARMRLAFCNGDSDKMTIFQFQGLPYDSAIEVPFHFGANHPDSLHKLQNLFFALTGKELEVIL